MDFKDFLSKNRRGINKTPVSSNVNEDVEKEVISENHVPISFRQETYIQKEIKKNKRYIGEVAELPSTVDFEEGTLARKGQTVFIKQDGLWESLIEGNTVTREVVKYGVPGGGCGVNEVKNLITEQAAGRLFLLNGTTETTTSATVVDLKSFDQSYNFNIIGLKVEGPKTGVYSAVVKFYTYENNSFKLAATSVITNTNNVDGILFLSENKQWAADLQVTSGIVEAPGIIAKVVL